MTTHSVLLRRFAKLNVYKAKHGIAPHKPLLLLVVIELAEAGSISTRLNLTAELSYRFDCFWKVVAHRRTQLPNVRLPFHHIGGDKLWSPFDEHDRPSKDKSITTWVELVSDFREALRDTEFRHFARRVLIATYFQPAERRALYSLLDMDVPDDDAEAINAMFEAPDDAHASGRDGRFRIDIVTAYDFTCALTGYRVTTITGGAIVDAAHIHQFSDSRNNDPRNGMALCKNAHWLFDTGLWSLDDEFRVIVAKEQFAEAAPQQTPLSDLSGRKLLLPDDQRHWPDVKHIRWHRKHRFQGI